LCRQQACQVGILTPNTRNLAFFKVVCHEKIVYGMYVIVWHFLAIFDSVGMKKHYSAFFKTSGLVIAVGLEL